jgi:FAD:protein FMN transferase
MKRTDTRMGMPITVEIVDPQADEQAFTDIYDYFADVDRRYSTYKPESEISQINAGLPEAQWSTEMKAVLELCEQTKQATNGYFNIMHHGTRDPSGLVKGWAIQAAAQRLLRRGFQNFYVDAGGDIQPHGRNAHGVPWRVGIRNPFNRNEVVKVVAVSDQGVATSGTYVRGQHIYDPHQPDAAITDVAGLTVIGPNIYEADRFATAAFAMGRRGIAFIEDLVGFEGYMIDAAKQATFTSGFERYVVVA